VDTVQLLHRLSKYYDEQAVSDMEERESRREWSERLVMRRPKTGEEHCVARFSVFHWLLWLHVTVSREKSKRECCILSTLDPFRQRAKLLLLLA
jgi:hypothetical protein